MRFFLVIVAVVCFGGCASQSYYGADGKKIVQNYGDLEGDIEMGRDGFKLTTPQYTVGIRRVLRYNKQGILIEQIDEPAYARVSNSRVNDSVIGVSVKGGRNITGTVISGIVGVEAARAAAGAAGPIVTGQ